MAKPTAYRLERPGEEGEVRGVVRAAFGDSEGVERIVDDLRTSDAWTGLSFVAEHEGRVAGHVLFTRSLLDAPDRLVPVLVLSPLAVLPVLQERGIGSALVRYALGEHEDRPEPLVFLEGSPAYYARFGFLPGADIGFRRPLSHPTTFSPRPSRLRLDASRGPHASFRYVAGTPTPTALSSPCPVGP